MCVLIYLHKKDISFSFEPVFKHGLIHHTDHYFLRHNEPISKNNTCWQCILYKCVSSSRCLPSCFDPSSYIHIPETNC